MIEAAMQLQQDLTLLELGALPGSVAAHTTIPAVVVVWSNTFLVRRPPKALLFGHCVRGLDRPPANLRRPAAAAETALVQDSLVLLQENKSSVRSAHTGSWTCGSFRHNETMSPFSNSNKRALKAIGADAYDAAGGYV